MADRREYGYLIWTGSRLHQTPTDQEHVMLGIFDQNIAFGPNAFRFSSRLTSVHQCRWGILRLCVASSFEIGLPYWTITETSACLTTFECAN
jgi:hypothetical protein